ncbi:hypothetical protein G7066_05815 [Leucobacter coleopterorum]|uniref:Lipoprotein n=1 Tax=Leucobacter coleopterorum TaxID=2714933 RepID=A0ABX6JZU6_9MICO|nr:hypothetical protein [Leucobacter coleopterorum]QIM18290.1 hypothetical protein G7066_05815 [Leucobacter coleopterorum]
MKIPREQNALTLMSLPLVGAICVTALLLSGCASTEVDGSSKKQVGTEESDVPDFSGPWATNFSAAYAAAESDFERSVLEDEKITDQELAETLDRFTTCLEAYGHYDIKIKEDSSFTFQSPENAESKETEKQVTQCSAESGEQHISSLHAFIRINPDNLDVDTIMAACLVKKGAVDPSYSAADFALDAPGQTFPYLSGHGASDFTDCNADPLGLFD